MIQDFGNLLGMIWDGFDIPMTVYGFSFSFQQVFMFSVVASIIFGAIGWFFWGR